MEIVVDASFAGAWLLPDEATERAERLLERIASGADQLIVPDLWTYELVNLLVVALRRGRLREAQMRQALDLIDAVPCMFQDHHSRLARERIAGFCSRYSLSAYDASYLELADRFRAPLHTLDEGLRQAAESIGLEP